MYLKDIVDLKRIGDVAQKSIRWFVASGKVHAINKGGEDNNVMHRTFFSGVLQ